MNVKTTKWVLAMLFVLIYVPFLYQSVFQKSSLANGDFPSFYWGAKLAFTEHRSPYVTHAFSEAELQLKQPVYPYLYPPPSLLAFYPFSLISYQAATLMLLITSHICILAVIYLFFFKIKPLDEPLPFRGLISALWVVYFMAFYAIVDTLFWGQINLIVLALLCLTWYALKRKKHDLTIALPLSIAILLKSYPLLLVPLLLIEKRYRAAVGVVVLIGLYTVIAWWVLPQSLWGGWLTNVAPTGGYGQTPFDLFLPVAPWNHSINGFGNFLQSRYSKIFWMSSHVVGTSLSYFLSAFVLTATVGLSYLRSRKTKSALTLDMEVSLFLIMMVLVAPMSWEHHLVFILPPALIAIYLMLVDGTHWAVRLVMSACLLILAWNLPRHNLSLMEGPVAFIGPIKFYIVFVLWAFFALRLWRGLRGGPEIGTTPSRG